MNLNCPFCGHVYLVDKRKRSKSLSCYSIFKSRYRTARLRCAKCGKRRLCRKTTSLCYYCHLGAETV